MKHTRYISSDQDLGKSSAEIKWFNYNKKNLYS